MRNKTNTPAGDRDLETGEVDPVTDEHVDEMLDSDLDDQVVKGVLERVLGPSLWFQD